MTKSKRIGILTSGGDCAGLNAIIRAVVHRAVHGFGWEVVGIEQGTAGLYERPPLARPLNLSMFDGSLLRQGGTILGTTNKGDPFAFPMPDGSVVDRSQEIIDGYNSLKLDALIGIGGDGSQAILKKIADQGGINLICIPKTIDNDIGVTELAVGYDTAMNVATDALDKLQPTASSHSRVMILEVMGRDAGHIALAAGIAGGADVILIPEIPYSLDAITNKINTLRADGRNYSLIMVAEAVKLPDGNPVMTTHSDGTRRYGGIGHWLGDEIARQEDVETRVTVLGHIQRGGTPSPRDRLMASVFGVRAVDLIAEGKFDRMVGWASRNVIDLPIADAIATYACVDTKGALVETAHGLGICLGE